jgi:hypothetical protein
MKTPSSVSRLAGFTLGETIVAIGMASVVAVCGASMLLNGLILFAKNTAENVAHDQNRIAINRLVRDIHAAISIPQLGHMVPGNLQANPTAPSGSWTPYGTNVTFWADTGTGPSAGIGFKKMGSVTDPNGGPFQLKQDPGNPDLIMIESFTTVPYVGMDAIFPYYNDSSGRPMEGIMYKVESNGSNHYNIWIQGGLEQRIKVKKNTNVICYYVSRYCYAVENGKLNFYSTAPPPTGVTWPVTLARNIINESNRALAATPFTQATTEFVGINLTTEDNRYSNRNYKAVNTLLAGSVPIRAQLSKTQ